MDYKPINAINNINLLDYSFHQKIYNGLEFRRQRGWLALGLYHGVDTD
jgi:hypothetical protein